MFAHSIREGLELRLLEEHHAEALFALTHRNREHLRQWLPWVDSTHSPYDSRRFITTALERFARHEGYAAGIWLDGSLVGSIDLHQINWANRAASVGYWLSAAHQGKGIMTSACSAVVNDAFEEVRLHRVEIRCGVGNTRSCAIPERLGFRQEGLLREAEWVSGRWVDLYVYAMLEKDWRERAGAPPTRA